ncbi:MAG TPA: ornithine carbamoyltransferase [Ktedonobacterales bacterium]
MYHLLTLEALGAGEAEQLYAHARHLKRTRGTPLAGSSLLAGRTLALLFEKPSLRTRVSFEVAARELGAQTLYLAPAEVGLGKRESIADVARVLSGYIHGVVLRTFRHETLEEFAACASVPVVNGLSDRHHPCQGLTDVFTIDEQLGSTAGVVLAYVGDGNNVAHSLVQLAAKGGMHVRLASPPGYEADAGIIAAAQQDACGAGGSVVQLHDPREAVLGADVVYTDVWTSMGQEDEAELRRAIFAHYQVNTSLLALANPDAIVMHPLPAHRGEEITDEVVDGSQSCVFVQAENRLHVQKAILRSLLGVESLAALTA